MGMAAGFSWGTIADYVVVYTDLGISDGMKQGLRIWNGLNKEVYMRRLPDWI
jgi:hypothetical protein